jgi:hypothetical protein
LRPEVASGITGDKFAFVAMDVIKQSICTRSLLKSPDKSRKDKTI